MSVSFPAGYIISRDTTIVDSLATTNDELDDGTLLVRVLGQKFAQASLRITMMTRSEMLTLLTFINTNRANEVTMEIDGINYVGRITGPVTRTMTGIRYNLAFEYRAREV